MHTLMIPLQELKNTYERHVIAEIVMQSKRTVERREGGIWVDHYLIAAGDLLTVLMGESKHNPAFLAIKHPERHCNRCGHSWTPRKNPPAKGCPKCNSLYWDKPRVRSKKTLGDIEK